MRCMALKIDFGVHFEVHFYAHPAAAKCGEKGKEAVTRYTLGGSLFLSMPVL